MKKKIAEAGGYIGMVLLQGATIPATLEIVFELTSNRPPITMIVMMIIGLFLYLVRSIVQKDLLYTISNTVGVIANTVLLLAIIN